MNAILRTRKAILTFALAMLTSTVLTGCGSGDSIVGVRPIPPVAPSDTVPTPQPVVPVTGTWISVTGPGVKDVRFDLSEDAGGVVTGTYTLTRLLCGCTVSGNIYSNQSIHLGLGVILYFTVEHNGRGSFLGNLNAAGELVGQLSMEYDVEPDSEPFQGAVVLTR
jgi:hypothetical protein